MFFFFNFFFLGFVTFDDIWLSTDFDSIDWRKTNSDSILRAKSILYTPVNLLSLLLAWTKNACCKFQSDRKKWNLQNGHIFSLSCIYPAVLNIYNFNTFCLCVYTSSGNFAKSCKISKSQTQGGLFEFHHILLVFLNYFSNKKKKIVSSLFRL